MVCDEHVTEVQACPKQQQDTALATPASLCSVHCPCALVVETIEAGWGTVFHKAVFDVLLVKLCVTSDSDFVATL